MTTQIRASRATVLKAPPAVGRQTTTVVRFDVHQRIQHFLMMSSFIVLAITGLPQKFSDLGPSQWWVATLGGLQTVRDIHHIAALVMLGDGVYHVGYLGYRIGIQRRLECFKMLPTLQDARDGGQMVLYFLGIAKQKPRFGRFSYLEKFDYWAVFWGIAIIGGSGLVLMFTVPVTSVLPGQAVTVARTLHSDEAMLAVGWILVVHMFNVHLAPWVFPFNPAIFTGKMSASRYVEDHPLEWARLEAAASSPQTPRAAPAPSWWSRAAATVRSASQRVRARAGQLHRVAITAVGTGTRRVVVKVRERFAR